ncbi:urease accessory protein UreE [Pelagibacterium montanilacus]|uniref:urease accessory protein UreE n=1 Tax=Pelagibacterium montanilacus TaxID=2185280 RepID=UPI000F8D7912|nr:urease accessory protein UreE [Pelagibacterium montanilacus]
MRATDHDHKGHGRGAPLGRVTLAHDERTLRRKLLTLEDGTDVLVDLPQTVKLEDGDVLVLEDGRHVDVAAAPEALLEIRARDTEHLMALCWHLGNRHLPCQIDYAGARLLIGRDHVIAAMLEGLGATLAEIEAPFSPLRGAYHEAGGHGHHHDHGHDHHH